MPAILRATPRIDALAPFAGRFGERGRARRCARPQPADPGIAEALFATAMGLAAAIPAVVAYNKITVDLGRFAGRMQGLIGRSGSLLSRIRSEA